jgi:formamidopyrimidine-DNA glycosylase
MPELPEVETLVRRLAPHLRGALLEGVELLDQRLAGPPFQVLHGRTVTAVLRSGKRIVLELSPGAASPRQAQPDASAIRWLAIHLRMSGHLEWFPEAVPQGIPHLRARLRFRKGVLLFRDVRRFGTLEILTDRRQLTPPGVDPLSPTFTPETLARLLAGSRQRIKPWLLRQDRITGLGNIYANEALFRAGLSPLRRCHTLETGEIARLHRGIVELLRDAIDYCGTTLPDFQSAWGDIGSFQDFLAVYGRAELPCRQCGAMILRIVEQGRSTYYCPSCQPTHPRGE